MCRSQTVGRRYTPILQESRIPCYHDINRMSTDLSWLLRGTIVNRAYGTHKNLYISVFLLTIFGPINFGPP